MTNHKEVDDRARRLWWILFSIFVFFAAFYTLTALGSIESYDGEMMFRVTRSLVEHRSLVITDEIFHANEPYSVYGLGTSIAAIPFFGAGRLLGQDPRWFVSLLNPFVTALTAALIYDLSRRLRFPPAVCLFVTFGFGIGSLAWPYTKTFYSEPLTTLCLVAATVGGLAFRQGAGNWSLVLVGAALGFGVLTREDTFVAVPLLLSYLVWSGRRGPGVDVQQFASLLVPLLVFVAITWWYHELRFHSLLSGYVAKTGNAFDLSPGTFLTGLYGFLLSSGKGLPFYTPLVLLSVFAWRRFWSALPLECGLFTLLILERVVFFSFLIRWYGGVCWGPRYIVPIVPFLIVPVGFLLSSPKGTSLFRQSIVGGVFLLSVLAQLSGVAVSYPLYWNATINTRLIVPDQIFFSPRWSPLLGQLHWLIQGQHVQWLLPMPWPTLATPVRVALLVIGLLAAGATALLHRSNDRHVSAPAAFTSTSSTRW